MRLRASSLPILAECPSFQSGESSDFANTGTDRHTALGMLCRGNDSGIKILEPKDAEGVTWAAEFINFSADRAHQVWEDELSSIHLMVIGGETITVEIPGHPDCYAINPDFPSVAKLFDLKWRRRDYNAQMAAYALCLFDKFDSLVEVECHVLFAESQKVETTIWTQISAYNCVQKALTEFSANPNPTPRPCDYCGWCSKLATCPAYLARANAVVAGREDWECEQYHSSKVETPNDMGKLLTLARLLQKWVDSVEFHALKLATEGKIASGFDYKNRAGNKFVSNLGAAQQVSPVDAETFLACCKLSLTDLAKAHARNNSITEKVARAEIETALEPYISRAPDTKMLKAIKSV